MTMRTAHPAARALAALALLLAASPVVAVTANEKTLVLMGNYTIGANHSVTGCTPTQVQGILFGNPDFSVSQAFRQSSYGTYVPAGNVYGPFELVPDPAGVDGGLLRCGQYLSLASKLDAAAANSGVNLANFQRFVYVLPFNAGCSVGNPGVRGLTGPANKHYIFACDSEGTYEHEIGHGFGFGHVVDEADPMGPADKVSLFNAAHALQTGWVPPASVKTLTADGTYVVGRLEWDPASGPAKWPLAYKVQTTSGTRVLSYRQLVGVDRRLIGPQNSLRINREVDASLDGAVGPGQTSTIDGVTIRHLANNATHLAFSLDWPGTAQPPCTPNTTTACLAGGRFAVNVSYRNANGSLSGVGQAAAYSDDTALFSFFGASNVELAVKVLDHTLDTGFQWVFHGGLTDLQYVVQVTDKLTGTTETYTKPVGSLCGGSDTEFGLSTGSGPGGQPLQMLPPTTTAPDGRLCAPGPNALCLQGGVVRVQVDWTANGSTGVGLAQPLVGDQSGLFSFFGAGNIELLVKVLDGRAINQHYWIFAGALSDVAYTVTFTNLVTGKAVTLRNPPGNLCGNAVTDQL